MKSVITLDFITEREVATEPHFIVEFGKAVPIVKVTDEIKSNDYPSLYWACGSRQFYMDVKGVAKFSIHDRHQVVVELQQGVKLEKALPFFYGTVLTVMLHMQKKFPIHASAVLSKDGLNLFCAHSGTGKSTLAFNLSRNGYPLFSDDKCVLEWDRILQKYLSKPSIRAVRLWQDAIDNISDSEILDDGIRVIDKENKFQFNLDNAMYQNLQTLNKIFIIHKENEIKKVIVRELKGQQKLKALKSQIHRPGLIIGVDIKERHQKFINNLAVLVPVFYIKRPSNIPIADFVKVMKKQIGKPFVEV